MCVEGNRMLALKPTHLLINRPAVSRIILRGLSTTSTRFNNPPNLKQDPKTRAQLLIDKLPNSATLSKTGILGTSAAAAIYVISNELYVINEESLLVVTFLAVCGIMAKYAAPAYGSFARDRIKKVSDILNSSKERHINAVKERIDTVKELSDVSKITKVLFDVSKETVGLEADIFKLRQEVELNKQAKDVLDSWVRYEASLRQLEQKQIAKTVIERVEKQINDPQFQEKILEQSIKDVEKLLLKN